MNDFDTGFCLIGIDELAEPLTFFRIFDDLRPLARIRIDQELDTLFQLLAEAQLVLNNDLFQMLDTTLEFLNPDRSLCPCLPRKPDELRL